MTGGQQSPHAGEPGRQERSERLYEEARALPPEERAAFLDRACSNDERLRTEIGSLLDHAHAAESFFERLAEVVIPPESLPGRAVGRYRILSCIGAGGMGAVYRAHDEQLDRDVALKFLPAHASGAPDVEERLLIEAKAAAALEHPNVCTVHEVGETEEGWPFIAMACYDGETLKERLARGPLQAAEATDIAAQIGRGLSAAHTQAIVHRDVKPGNVMLTSDGTVKLLDFGLARIADQEVTRPGVTPGTVAYMSPEQIHGGPVGPPSDLWSLGVVLYEMLTGVHPFRRGNERATAQAILHAEPAAIREHAPDAPRSLERITERLLRKEPDDRYGSAAELIEDLCAVGSSPDGLPRRDRPAPLVLAGTLLVVLAGVGIWWSGGTARPGSTADGTATAAAGAARPEAPRTIAVLPFTNLSRDPEEEYLSDGLTDELIGALSRVGALRVAARTSTYTFKGGNQDIREIGEALNVGSILEGTVRRVGDRLRVEAGLIDVEDGLHLWSGSYEREMTDILTIQRDLALMIADTLRVALTPTERIQLGTPPTASADAFAMYLKGRHFWNQRTPDGHALAIDYYQRAIAADPLYANPHAGLADVYLLQGLSGAVDPRRARTRAEAAVQRALTLDGDLPEAHSALGLYLHAFEWNAEAAEGAFQRAIELGPSYTPARHDYGNLLAATGRLNEAIAQKSRAVHLDPLAPALSETLAMTLLRAGRPNDALRHVSNAIELDSTYWRAHAVLGLTYEAIGRTGDAIREFDRANELAGFAAHRTLMDIARVLARNGRLDEAGAHIAELQAAADSTGTYEPSVATAILALGEADAAFDWLERGYRSRHPHLPFISGDVRFEGFQEDPRFLDLMRRVGVLY